MPIDWFEPESRRLILKSENLYERFEVDQFSEV